ncbi:MAG: hypothetical protein KA116_11165 [Proteobacteria bacterium]|nr:hypothetical protein [Pseudomonadota bacterium]
MSGLKDFNVSLTSQLLSNARNYPEPFSSQIQKATMNAYDTFLKSGKKLPPSIYLDNDTPSAWVKAQARWEKETKKKLKLLSHDPILIKAVPDSLGVFKFSYKNKDYIFRPFLSEATPQKPHPHYPGLKNHIIQEVAQYFNRTDIIPSYEAVKIKATLEGFEEPIEISGMLSNLVKGKTKIKSYDKDSYKYLEEFPNRDNINSNSIIQFLVNNDDIHYQNFFLNSEGKIIVFDQDESLINLIPHASSISGLGTIPPFEYKAEDIKKLKKIAAGKWNPDFWKYLPWDQKIAFQFRAQILLEDAKLRGFNEAF